MRIAVKSNSNIVYQCHYHVVFCPKYWRKVLVGEVASRLKTIILDLVAKWGQECLSLEIMPDHVHLLLNGDPPFGLHRLLKSIKGASSHQLRQEVPPLKRQGPSLWTNSDSCGTTGGVTLEVVKRSIESQKGK